MKKHHILSNLRDKILFICFASCVLSLNAYGQSGQQNTFLDADGRPIPNDILLQLSTTTKVQKPDTKNTVRKKPKKVSNPILEEELFHALKSGQTLRAKHLLKSGIAPTYKNLEGETPLGIAVTRGWASMVVELLENDANINEKGARGVTLIHAATARGLTDVAKLLVKRGLNPAKKTDKNWTPLHVAARYGHWQLVQYYLSLGVDPDIRNSDGQTALGLARHMRHHGIIKILSPVTTRRSLSFKSAKKKRRKRRSSRRK